jgi:hypothetical protein
MHNEVQAIPQQMQILSGSSAPVLPDGCWAMGWQPIETAPFGRELHLSVIEDTEVHALVFPCWRTGEGWFNCQTNKAVPLHPTHWRAWET